MNPLDHLPTVSTRRPISLRDVSRRIRGSKRRHPSPPEGGVTLVGDDVLTSNGHHELLEDVVRREGETSAPTHPQTRTVLLFQPNQDPQPISEDDIPVALRQSGAFLWIAAGGYSAADLIRYRDLLDIPQPITRSIQSPWHRPTLAMHRDRLYLSATVPHIHPNSWHIEASELDMCLGEHFLLSVNKMPLPFRRQLEARVYQSAELIRLDAAFLLYLTLDELLAYYEQLNRHIQIETERLEERALHETSDTFLEDLLRFKRYVFAITHLADQHRDVFSAFFRPDFHWIAGEDIESSFRDLQDRLVMLMTNLGQAKEAVNGALNIYVSQLSQRTNQIIKLLTMISTILYPASLIVGIFGSSVEVLLPNYGHYWFGAMLVTLLIMSLIILLIFIRQGWISLRLRERGSE